MQVKAPAKVNLVLRVLGKRSDGFHELETLMVPVDLCDKLTYTPESTFRLNCSNPNLGDSEDNLVVRAWRAVEQETGRTLGGHLKLTKNIPHGAGLGGGSSDAAATLRLANQVHQLSLTDDILANLAAELGSDVPFFLANGPAWCRGRGERVVPVTLPPGLRLRLLKPAFAVQTPDAYGRWADSKKLESVCYKPQNTKWGDLQNDLERPVFAKHLVLAEMKTWLARQPGVQAALLSGSGSTVFGVLKDEHPDIGGFTRTLHEHFGDGVTVFDCKCAY